LRHVPIHTPQEYALSFQSGEEIGFAWFFRLLYPSLIHFAYKISSDRLNAEEIASTAFIKIWKRHSQFNSPESIRAYLYQIVRNDALKSLKKDQKEAALQREVSYLWLADKQKDHFQSLVAAETTRQLVATMDLLPPQCGRVFKMLYVEGKTVKETAQELNLSLSTVRTQQKRGLDTLRQKMTSLLSVLLLILCNQL
jgi:RNA polymerase sigma-70 factor (family 1)